MGILTKREQQQPAFLDGTPWGVPQNIKAIGPGIWQIETGSHGGFYVNHGMNAQVPEAWRNASFNGQGVAGWYEEDCDWAMVALAFPQHFTAEQLLHAVRTFQRVLVKMAKPEARS